MMGLLIFFVVCLLCIELATGQSANRANSQNVPEADNRQRTSTPRSALMSELGNLFLDIDETLAKQTVRKFGAEQQLAQRLHETTQNLRSNYFKRIRENYKEFNNRLGSVADNLLTNSNDQKQGPKTLLDLASPIAPVKLSIGSSNPKLESKTDTLSEDLKDGGVPRKIALQSLTSSLKVGNAEISLSSVPGDSIFPSVSLNFKQDETRKKPSEIKKSELPKDPLKKPTEESKENSLKESTAVSDTSSAKDISETKDLDPSGRIIGDVLYSEETFDKIMKRLLKDTKWILDSQLAPSKIANRLDHFSKTQQSGQPVNNEVAREELLALEEDLSKYGTKDQEKNFAKRISNNQSGSSNSLHYNVEPIGSMDKMNFHFIPQPHDFSFQTADSQIKTSSEGTVLLAFTTDGTPLQLRMGPEVKEPLKFLHRILRESELSLNIPVRSLEDIEPVGRDILQLGSRSEGLTRALDVDLSNPKKMESLLKNMKRLKKTN